MPNSLNFHVLIHFYIYPTQQKKRCLFEDKNVFQLFIYEYGRHVLFYMHRKQLSLFLIFFVYQKSSSLQEIGSNLREGHKIKQNRNKQPTAIRLSENKHERKKTETKK